MNFEISFHKISLNAHHSYNEHAEQQTLLIQLWAVLVWAILVIALGRFVPVLAVLYLPGPFWTCQKFVGRFGLGRFGFGPFWYRPGDTTAANDSVSLPSSYQRRTVGLPQQQQRVL